MRFGMTVALILAATVRAVIEPQLSVDLIREDLLRRVRRKVICAKAGRSYPRPVRHKHRGRKRGKGNTKAQYQRKKLRQQLAKLSSHGG